MPLLIITDIAKGSAKLTLAKKLYYGYEYLVNVQFLGLLTWGPFERSKLEPGHDTRAISGSKEVLKGSLGSPAVLILLADELSESEIYHGRQSSVPMLRLAIRLFNSRAYRLV